MLKMRVVQAHEGDCFLLLYGTAAKPRALLCDGGPKDTYEPHLRETLEGLKLDTLDAVILSHVDTDHALGLIDLFVALRDKPAAQSSIEIADLWINSFKVIDQDGTIHSRLAEMLQAASAQNVSMALASVALAGVKEGNQLALTAKQLDIPINRAVGGELFIADGQQVFDFHGLQVKVVGPTKANLNALAADWKAFIAKQKKRIEDGQLRLAAMADKSVPNLSSIQLFVKSEGKTLLLTGDGRGDHLLDGLDEAGLLDEEGGIDLDVLKVPHHGSDRNVNRDFFERVRAKTYVISADGKHGNPDLPTLQWILEARPENAEPITFVLTNEPPTVKKFLKAFPPKENGYKLVLRDPQKHFVDVSLVP
jgi:hypothetical protein